MNESINLHGAEEKQPEVGHTEDSFVQNQPPQRDLKPTPRLCLSSTTPVVVSGFFTARGESHIEAKHEDSSYSFHLFSEVVAQYNCLCFQS